MSYKNIPGLFLFSSITLWFLTPSFPAQGNPVADSSLPTPSVTGCVGNNCTIDGGTQVGNNLFHSFSQFSVPTGGTAYFNNNPTTVTNIINRVTGGGISNIDGLIQSNGTANLFLINPAGIIFGVNARLNVGGSFLATTANRIKFADGNEFSATNVGTPPLLTISVPIGLQFGQNPGAIRVEGTGHNFFSFSTLTPLVKPTSVQGLQVQPGKTLALVGGDINLEGGVVTAPAGRVELGSVANGFVSLNPIAQGWSLGYGGVQSFQDIRLTQLAALDGSGNNGGAITVQGRNVTLSDGSVFLITNQGSQSSGNIIINATGTVEIISTAPDFRVRTGFVSESLGAGNGANIEVNAPRLVVRNGALIDTQTFGTAKSGDINLNISESLEAVGFNSIRPDFFSAIASLTYSSGNAGNVAISTKRLSNLNGGNIGSITYGIGNSGDLIINATESVTLRGISPVVFQPSAIGTITFGSGNAGSMILNTDRLVMGEGSLVNANTFASGNAGSVTINAKDSVDLSGILPGTNFPDSISSSAPIVPLSTQKLFFLPPIPTGASGDVIINTGRLSITNGATVSALNQGSGKGGSVRINAGSIFLDHQGTITAATTSGEGGNIILQVENFLLMRHNSQISATAGGTGNGGNISINAPFLIATNENSDIIANAFQGRGGNINITTYGIYGLQFRPQLTPSNDITASSDFGVNGTVQINTPGIDPSQGLTSLPTGFTNVEAVKDNCQAYRGSNQSRFLILGRGGLPPSPDDPLSSEILGGDWITLESRSTGLLNQTSRLNSLTQNVTVSEDEVSKFKPHISTVVEAQGWVMNERGQVVLTAATTEISRRPWQRISGCNSPQ